MNLLTSDTSCCNLGKMSYCCRPLCGQGCNAKMWLLQSTVIKREMQAGTREQTKVEKCSFTPAEDLVTGLELD